MTFGGVVWHRSWGLLRCIGEIRPGEACDIAYHVTFPGLLRPCTKCGSVQPEAAVYVKLSQKTFPLAILLWLGTWEACGGGTNGETNGETNDGGTDPSGCSYLGCAECPGELNSSDLLCNGAACTTDGDCVVQLPEICVEDLGTFPTTFNLTHCIAGRCVYVMTRVGGCPDLTPCNECPANSPKTICATQYSFNACIDCCGVPKFNEYGPCACDAGPCSSVCAGTSICLENGTYPSYACLQCVQSTLQPNGACATNSEFLQRCIIGESCERRAQCIATCPMP